MFTVLLGVVFLDKHASNLGILALILSIIASTQYKQSPLRKTKADRSFDGRVENDDDDEESGDNISEMNPKQFDKSESMPLISTRRHTEPF
eukprot:CAMPEP_0114360322 /NCGR_PEP_ID=MMETSP0101-20121206/23773_1 /TAXON_ID=38822 ORGANISM="Pteridomonas danica, Strain PT" /NCGR_SAMPLE_ID=MMETSP0101 /ASSEMBLY_ACC=CAM_ASM_000211 /LENGTH=90 /DNA_ID=CAMNT_0001504493 /DNA_START=912 /DNA_END=1184 /DNA_ORIENTATION=+